MFIYEIIKRILENHMTETIERDLISCYDCRISCEYIIINMHKSIYIPEVHTLMIY